jgi:hypothetical protein
MIESATRAQITVFIVLVLMSGRCVKPWLGNARLVAKRSDQHR